MLRFDVYFQFSIFSEVRSTEFIRQVKVIPVFFKYYLTLCLHSFGQIISWSKCLMHGAKLDSHAILSQVYIYLKLCTFWKHHFHIFLWIRGRINWKKRLHRLSGEKWHNDVCSVWMDWRDGLFWNIHRRCVHLERCLSCKNS